MENTSDKSFRDTIFSNLTEGYFETDISGTITFSNNSFARLFGYTPERITGLSFHDIMTAHDSRLFYEYMDQSRKTREDRHGINLTLTNRNGVRIGIEASIFLLTGPDHSPRGFRGLFREVTDILTIKSNLSKMENRYNEIVNTLPEMIFELDINGKIIFCNDHSLQLLGYSAGEIIGMNVLDMIYESEIEKALRGLNKSIAGTIHSGKVFHFRMKGGQMLPVELYTSPIYNDNIVVGIRGIAIDVSQIYNSQKALHESEEKFRTMIEHSSEIITVIDANGVIQFDSFSTSHVLGYEPRERVGNNAFDLIHPDDIAAVKDVLDNSIKNNIEINVVQYRYLHKNGSWKYLESTGTNLLNDPLIKGIILNSRDITEQKSTEKSLIRREEKFRSLYNNALIAMITIDVYSGTIVESNDLGYRLFGYERKSEFIGRLFSEFLISEKDKNLIEEVLGSLGSIDTMEIELRNNHGTSFWGELSAKYDHDTNDLKAVIVDTTKRRNAEQLVLYYTFHDQLTGLPNREMFTNKIEMEIIKSSDRESDNIFSVMCIGIDRFKNINEMHGHALGDKLLKKIAERLRRSIRQNDLLSRFSGDKFMVLFTDMRKTEGIIDIVQKSFNTFADPFIIDSTVLNVTISIGICMFPNDGVTAESLIQNSEAAMYQAKGQGRNSYTLFDPNLNTQIIERLKIEHELQYAIYNNEFIAFYQPKVFYNGKISGMESLIRWQSPNRGLILPSDFIPLAEKNGMIESIGNLILFQSCMQNKKWQDLGYAPLRMSVNLSPFQFRQEGLIYNIEKIIMDTSLDPKWLELEITESGLMENDRDSINKINTLSEMGIAIAIDDFGTGYSSFSKLKDLPISTIKIDKTFIENLPHDRRSATITTAIIDLAHNLGFEVVAEGVETTDQLEFLANHKCDHFQGFYFFKPLDSHIFEKRLQSIN